jgi:hypothetical protein
VNRLLVGGSRFLLAVLALLLGWLTPVHAVPPPVTAPIQVIAPTPDHDQAPPDVIVFLAAYRANGPPFGHGRAAFIFFLVGRSTHPGGWKEYAYAGGDPVNRWDPSGLYYEYINGHWQEDASRSRHPNGPPPDWLTPEMLGKWRGSQSSKSSSEYDVWDEMAMHSAWRYAGNGNAAGSPAFGAAFVQGFQGKYAGWAEDSAAGLNQPMFELSMHQGTFNLDWKARQRAAVINSSLGSMSGVLGTFVGDAVTLGSFSRKHELDASLMSGDISGDAYMRAQSANVAVASVGIVATVAGGYAFGGTTTLAGRVGTGAGMGAGMGALTVGGEVAVDLSASGTTDMTLGRAALTVGTGAALGAVMGGATHVGSKYEIYLPQGVAANPRAGSVAIPSIRPRILNGDSIAYGSKSPGLEQHHHIWDVWLKNNIPGYVSRKSGFPTLALTPNAHNATRSIHSSWLYRTRVDHGGRIDWSRISAREMQDLTEEMASAAGVTSEQLQLHYRLVNQWLYHNLP